MRDEFTCDRCRERVIPDFRFIDAGGPRSLGIRTAIKQCPDCGEVLAAR